MRGEHIVGENLTWVKGARPALDDTSRKILAGGRKPNGATGGARLEAARLSDDGTFARGDLHAGVDTDAGSGTSIFDPVLCELAYRWFCPPGGLVLDPFAGGSVRGIVASRLNRHYIGIDLNPSQVSENERQAVTICKDPAPRWIAGDAREMPMLIPSDTVADFVFSCPPYADLERYSDDPRDISTMDYPRFLECYRSIIRVAVGILRADRFACFVVGDVRAPDGLYRNFISDTIGAFHDAGARLYNEAILVTACGSLPIRAGRQFEASRKLGKTHQNVLVFCKGDPRAATEAVGAVEFGQPLPEA
jgi:hypothetical protein